MCRIPSDSASGTYSATSSSENCQIPRESIGIATPLLSTVTGMGAGRGVLACTPSRGTSVTTRAAIVPAEKCGRR